MRTVERISNLRTIYGCLVSSGVDFFVFLPRMTTCCTAGSKILFGARVEYGTSKNYKFPELWEYNRSIEGYLLSDFTKFLRFMRDFMLISLPA